MVNVPFCGASYKMDVLDISAQRSINLYPEGYSDQNTKSQLTLRPTHGLLAWALLGGAQQIRGLYLASDNQFFSVQGKRVETVATTGTPTFRFNLSTGDLPGSSTIVRMADNGTQLLIADGTTNAYTWNLSTSIATQITDADYPGGSFCGILDGFYIVNDPGTLFAYYSTLDDPTDWPTANTITKESTTDYITALIVHNGKLWIFGSQSMEIHYNTGISTQQFLRVPGSEKSIGIQAPDSLSQDGESVYWLGSNDTGFGKVYMSQGYEPVKISTIPIERAINGYTTTNDAEGLTFQQDGHAFYQLTFPSENKTWVFDKSTGMWHEKLYRNPLTSVDERHRARVQGFFNGNNYFGDWANNQVYEVSQSTYTDDGDTIIRTRIGPTEWQAQERLFYGAFQLDIGNGVGLATGQGSDPKMRLSWSDDGGHTFSDPRLIDLGKIGEYTTRVRETRLGASRERVWKVECSEPIDFNILSAQVEFA